MHAEYNMKYAADSDFEVLSIPYKKNEASMLIFLPKSKENFDTYLKLLDFEKYTGFIKHMAECKVNVTFPKFNMTSEFELKEVLSKMGMPLPFSDEADFSGITGQKNLAIDKVIHKAFVDVLEKGTEAAATTALVLKEIGSAMPNKEKIICFKADLPFVFMINTNPMGQILFLGEFFHP
jgi:serpin B